MKPSVIYSYIVDVLRNCRTGGMGWAASCDAARNLNPHAFACVLAECKAAVEERRDIADFRGVCEDILEKMLRMKLHLSEADANGMNPLFKKEMVEVGLMFKFDQCHPADGITPALDLTGEVYDSLKQSDDHDALGEVPLKRDTAKEKIAYLDALEEAALKQNRI